MPTKSLVLCRYNENVNWIQKFKESDLLIFIYDKGTELNFYQSNVKKIKLDKVGREAHTYFYHIVNNYNNLTDHIYFSQAYPFCHIPNYSEELENQLKKSIIENGFKWIGPKIYNNLSTNLNYGADNTIMPNGHPNPSYEDVLNEMIRVATKYVVHIFFIKPSELEKIKYWEQENLYHNHYSQKKLNHT